MAEQTITQIKEEGKSILTDELEKMPGLKEIIQELRLPNKVEMVKEEDFVIRSFLRHGNTNKIIQDLKKMHPETRISYDDIKMFLIEYKDAIMYQTNMNKKNAVQRMMKTREGLTHELLELATLSKELALKYDEAEDRTAAISAIKAAADIFYRNAKVEGILDEKPNVSINVEMDKMVLDATNQNSSFAMSLKKLVETNDEKIIDVEAEEIKDAEE